MKIPWVKCPSVTTGGKAFFLFGKLGGHTYHIVWDRWDSIYHAQIDNKTVRMFLTIGRAKKFLEERALD